MLHFLSHFTVSYTCIMTSSGLMRCLIWLFSCPIKLFKSLYLRQTAEQNTRANSHTLTGTPFNNHILTTMYPRAVRAGEKCRVGFSLQINGSSLFKWRWSRSGKGTHWPHDRDAHSASYVVLHCIFNCCACKA